MEGYLNDYAKTLEETKKAVDDQLREHQKVINCVIYYSSQAYFDDFETCPIRLTNESTQLVSCLKDAVYNFIR